MTQPDNNPFGHFDLLSLEIKIGDALQLQDVAGAEQARHYIKLIGFLNKQSLIVSFADTELQQSNVILGQEVQIRGFANRQMYEFNSRVIEISNSPYPHLHLAYPEQLNVITMRGALRIRINMQGFAQMLINPVKTPVSIDDLSTSGAKLSCKQALTDIDKEIILCFLLTIDGEEHPYNIAAIVRNTRFDNVNNAGESYVTHGVEFTGMSPTQRSLLQNYICKCIVEGQKKDEPRTETA